MRENNISGDEKSENFPCRRKSAAASALLLAASL
jgi:hypothetical protein